MRVRPAEERDRMPMAELFAAVAAERTGIASEPPVDLDARAARFDLDATFVAESDGETVGLIALYANDDGGAELGMMVAREWRRRGIGAALLEAAVAWARAREVRRLLLDVFARNGGAIAFYRSFGFVEDGRLRQIPRSSGEVWPAIGMTLELS
jgi:GNAT superfamily N-acetyltransferase